jgi:phospholipid-binding lipoprotein MlaA
MNTDKKICLPFISVLAVLLFFMPGFSIARSSAESEIRDNAGSGSVDPAALNETSATAGASAQSYYVVNENVYVIMQKPMAKAYGSFSLVPVVVPDTAGSSDIDAEPSVSSGDTVKAEADIASALTDSAQENVQDMDVAVNIKFRGPKSEESASGLNGSQDGEDIADPFEPINRLVFNFNDKLYFYALKPIATAYGTIVPEWGRTRIRNFVDNLQSPIRIVNALLQLKMPKFGAEFTKFLLNSTFGLGGLFDLAARHPELKTSKEDLGQTFGFWGLGEGFYLVLPFLGPSSLRDAVGTVGDNFLDPIGHITPLRDAVAARSFDLINDTSFKIGDYEDIKESALDPYISIRDIYKQYRRNKIRE